MIGRFASAILIAATIAGCGGPRDKVPVSGSVTWNGQPVPLGNIVFFSEGQVPGGGGRIEEGKFHCDCKPGKMTVQITASREGKIDPIEKAPTRVQYLPARYNRQTELSAEVTREGKNQFDFSLTEK